MELLIPFAHGAVVLLGAMVLLWLVSLPLRDVSIVDLFWGPSFLLSAGVWAWVSPAGDPTRRALVLGLVGVWALRLGLYLAWRNHGRGEDFRYQEFRRRYGARRYPWISLFQVFLLQGGLSLAVGTTVLGALTGPRPLNALDALGVLVWAVGFTFEAGGDWQLARFKRDPQNRGRLLTTGLWAWTRHPNYFGDAACWWGLGLLALASGHGAWVGGALLMTFLVVRVSGVALLERSMAQSKPGYEQYMRDTPAFFPRPPRRG